MERLQRPWEYPFVSAKVFVSDFKEFAAAAQRKHECHLFPDVDDIDLSDVCGELSSFVDVETMTFRLNNRFVQPDKSLDGHLDKVPPTELEFIRLRTAELKNRAGADQLAHRQTANSIMRYRRIEFKDVKPPYLPCPSSATVENDAPNKTSSKRKGLRKRKIFEEKDVTSSLRRTMCDDVVLTVYALKPYNRPLERHEIRLGRLLKMDSVFLVGGNNLLSELEEKLSCRCVSNEACMKKVDEDELPTWEVLHSASRAKDFDVSSFFFINDTFYNKLGASGKDISRPILNWAEDRFDFDEMKTADMGTCRFADLKILLGNLYLYRHQSFCDHIVVFTEMRVVTVGNCGAPTSVTFFCEMCYGMFNGCTMDESAASASALTQFQSASGGRKNTFLYVDRSTLPTFW